MKRKTSAPGLSFMGIFVVSCLLGMVGSPELASAQTPGTMTIEPVISNTLGIGADVGYYVCHEVDFGAPYLNVFARLRLGAVLGLEGAVGYRGKQHFKFDPVTDTNEDFSANVHSIPVTGSLILFIPLAPTFTPYLVGGVGGHYLVLDYSPDINERIPDKSKVLFGYHLGFGLEIPLNNHVALMGDYRYLFIDNAFEKELEFDFSSTKYRYSSLSGGVVVYF